jgi:hypothetical protein
MAFFRDCCVVTVLTQSHRQAMLPHCAQARLALTKKSSTGDFFYG